MPRKSLRPNLNQIRTWVRQGRTDAWVAHQLDVSVRDIEQFKRQNELVSDEGSSEGTIAAELEAAEIEAERARAEAQEQQAAAEEESGAEAPRARTRRRGGRGRRGLAGRGRAAAASSRNVGPLEGTFDHGEEGYGLWLDPAIQDNPIYAEHWAGHRPVEVDVEEDRIVIRRVGEDD